ncbi:alpha-1,3-mannosyl-glycoprotein 4-beta-N-acetylglucosaminyltransferase B isoform X1 [Bombus huntii]|uniref:alpha-1,3-mannosyl-glycoprotein 4-beta-N-acetylglucosaminyltransferase B isoform X1 n=1 Tax=Bombus huntii TaxID=85661 RepID=UPI0021AAAB45|nr:alpha-1,3-mannosyl-glycoprotein 4-beta-N-acetylglucosaminyltransferase B isoform X1 [Bombus huntii]XP_050471614.1 alpha-1,3-mannosyl-glycoprotein 4-beta-N-acetylglucosaminyltransferase B isoform X1 [Bombus huntii]XP_050471703.1 alpha-1,3-mannosyl-glycoprotein 4-beta-N-acetylglucosaminyltransferase B isoform X1 [Bombus huntii]XP_050471788.1 alpha-1,3-mannosyl-glycoprotein 4-beta-N-acetylglucosaminyltransferase B isoform X1 [Bombus huntii]
MTPHFVALTPIRRRCLIILSIVLIPCAILNLLSPSELHEETVLQNSIAELQAKLEHLHAKYITSQEEINLLSHQLLQLIENNHILPDLQFLLNNTTSNVTNIKLPSIYNFLPHFLNDPTSLRPAFVQSKGRTGVSMVLGVPTVKREVQSYLMATLKNLLDRMNSVETADTLIIVLIAETDLEYVTYVAKQIEVQFPTEFEAGVIDVISPSASYYPDLSKLHDTLGDDHQRVVWRSKQNLDFAFLMSYAQTKGTFYVQLEDDILAKKNFITTMKSFALQKIATKENWFVLDFCQLGFIGKLFKCAELPWLIQFFLMFHNDKPVDWLLDHLVSTKVCSLDKDSKHCKMAKAELWVHYKPSLFQHIGTHSSLKGKVQKLKDKQFGKITLYYAHENPEAIVETQIKPYKQYTLQKAYKGESFFWGLLPQPGDHLKFKFSHPIFIKRYLFRSGNPEHPSDRFYNTTVEVFTKISASMNRNSNDITEDGYVIIGKFDALGIAQGTVDPKLGKILILRLTVHSESENWAILSEVFLVCEQGSFCDLNLSHNTINANRNVIYLTSR